MPCYGPRRLAAIQRLQDAIASDCWKAVAAMVAEGWDVIDAFRAYEGWLIEVVTWGIVDAVRSWREGTAA